MLVYLCAIGGLAIGLAAGVFATRARAAANQRALIARHADELRQRDAAHARDLDARLAERRLELEKDNAKQRQQGEQALARERERLAQERSALLDDGRKLDRRDDALIAREQAAIARDQALGERERALDRRGEAAEQREREVARREGELQQRSDAATARELALTARDELLKAHEAEAEAKLSAIAHLTRDEARDELLRRVDAQLADEQARRVARSERDATTRAQEQAREIIGRAIQRYAAEHTAETTTSKVVLADEEMKGRIIGKEGRNIKAFEQATGVDLIVDETPGVITLSCFSGLRREIAKRALVVLMEDGRIHPARIEEVMAQVQQDIDREVLRLGEDAAFACEISGLHPQLLKLLGKLHYRTSYGQNVLKHTQEVAYLCAAMAGDLGLDPRLARRCGLMHDIGKAIDHDQEGTHPVLGHEVLKRYGESEIVANAALAHHEGQPVLSLYTTMAAAADAISAARPGARSHDTERYLKRLAQLEEIACGFPGVHKAYAIQAGRELRVIVNHHDIADPEMPKLARDIARQIADQVTFPGEVKVTMIRETRCVTVAR